MHLNGRIYNLHCRGHLQTRQYASCTRLLAAGNGSHSTNDKSHNSHANGHTDVKGNNERIEMYVSTMEELEEWGGHAEPGRSLRHGKSVHVVPPRNGAPHHLQHPTPNTHPQASQQHRSEMKALQAELGISHAELQTKSEALRHSQQALRAKDGEVALLRAALTGRDIGLRNAKAALAESHSALQEKDSELQVALQQLLSNAKERGAIRQQVVDLQTELSEALAERNKWIEHSTSTTDADAPHSGTASASRPAGEVQEEGQLAELLSTLSQLSQQIAADALADESSIKASPP